MWGAIASGVGSLLGGLVGGGGDSAADVAAKQVEDAGIKSAVQGSNPMPPGSAAPTSVSGSQSGQLLQDAFKDGVSSVISGGINKLGSKVLGTDAAGQGKATRDYLAKAFPELTPWERAGAGGTMSGSADAGFQQQVKLQEKELDNQVKLKQMDNETQLKIAGINSTTSMRNVDSQMFPEMMKLEDNLQILQDTAAQIRANTSLSEAQRDVALKKVDEVEANTRKLLYANPGVGGLFLGAGNAGWEFGKFYDNNKAGFDRAVDGVRGAVNNSALAAGPSCRTFLSSAFLVGTLFRYVIFPCQNDKLISLPL